MLKRIGRVRSKRWRTIHRYKYKWICNNDLLDGIMMFYLDICTSEHRLYDSKMVTFSEDAYK